jgi:hypothetical protein
MGRALPLMSEHKAMKFPEHKLVRLAESALLTNVTVSFDDSVGAKRLAAV